MESAEGQHRGKNVAFDDFASRHFDATREANPRADDGVDRSEFARGLTQEDSCVGSDPSDGVDDMVY